MEDLTIDDLDNISTGSDDHVQITPAEVIEMMEEAWTNEKFAPEILPNKSEIVDIILDQITTMEENIKKLSSSDFTKSIYQLEVDRLRFLVSSYLRTRLEKIETYVIHILKEEEKRVERGSEKYLTEQEFEFAKEFSFRFFKMRIALCLAFLLSAALAANMKINPLSDEFINHINSQQNNWKAGKNFDKNIPISKIKKLMGARMYVSESKPTPTVHSKDIEIPESFDARTNWPKCSKVIGEIADQSDCGSCWAVSTASAISDRRCIASGGSLQVPVSAEDLMSCCYACGDGCNGGTLYSAWDHWIYTGIVTGGSYNSSLGCRPYSLQPCDHHVDGQYVQCSTLSYDTPDCTSKCSSNELNYKSELTYGKRYTVEFFIEVEEVQKEILQNGPATASFVVYEDFLSYKTGVYHHVVGEPLGRHAVRIIGWGTENNVDYWLVANSWNEDWGDDGLFKIKRGVDECGIEEELYVAQAKV